MMLDNASYNKIKLIHELSCICWFIEKHGKVDAKAAGDQELLNVLNSLKNDLEKYLERLQQAMCTVTQ